MSQAHMQHAQLTAASNKTLDAIHKTQGYESRVCKLHQKEI